MRVVILGATGNVGIALARRLAGSPEVDELVGVARRLPAGDPVPGVRWHAADITRGDLRALVRGVDAVVHLAWLIQPMRHEDRRWATNVEGTARLLEAVAAERVGALVVASSVGAYSPGPKDLRVDESWPTHGVATSSYSRQKAYVERLLDTFERTADTRLVRLRPSIITQATSASQQRRFFAGALLPTALLRPGVAPVVPDVRGLAVQLVHTRDAAEAYARAVLSDERGAFNVASEPAVGLPDLARLLEARTVPVPPAAARAAMAAAWHLRLHPVAPGWFDLGMQAPLLSTDRARERLGWQPTVDGPAVLREAVEAVRRGEGGPTPTLRPGRDLVDELATGQGARYRRGGDDA